jgi:hypothetical protein
MVSSALSVEESQSLTASVNICSGSPAPQFTRCTFSGCNRLGKSSSSPTSPTMTAVFVFVFFFLAASLTGPLFSLPLTMTPTSTVHNACAFGRHPRLFLLKYCGITVLLPFIASSALIMGFFGGGASLLVLNCNHELESRSGFEFLIVAREVQTCLVSNL